jgi:oligopeptide transport system substrate-binding protein
MSSGMRKALSLLALAAGCGLLAASAFASADQAPPPDTLRVSLSIDIDYVDPALANYAPTWALEYATGAMLFNYPDAPSPRGSRLMPEVAAGFPRVSRDGKTYTFRLRKSYRFSSGRRVAAVNFVRAFERARDPRLRSPARTFAADVVDARAVGRWTLRIRTKRRSPDLLARLAMPFFTAVPVRTPVNPNGIEAPVVSAGPYYIRGWARNRSIVLERNPFYRGPRPRRVRRIQIDVGLPLETIKLNIDRGTTDIGELPPAAHAELGRRHGVRKRSPGRYFVNPSSTIHYFAFNHRAPLFRGPTPLGNIRLKRAINYVLDRRTMLNQFGEHGAITSDQLIPPTIHGFRDAAIYPRRPDLTRARAIAAGSLPEGGHATMQCSNRAPGPSICQLAQARLREIGLHVDIRLFCRGCPYRRPDITFASRSPTTFDPYDFVSMVDGASIRSPDDESLPHFDHPAYNRKIRRANQLNGEARHRAFAELDHDLMRNAAPVAVIGVSNARHYVSARTGCYHHHPVYGYDLPAICVR